MATTSRKHARKTMLAVDYPRQNEVVASDHYTIRIFAPENAVRVDLSIDQGPWKPCRPAVGFWWYDWSGYEDGEHEIIAAMIGADGKRIACEPHEFFVKVVQPI